MIPSSKADFSSKDYWTAFFKHNKQAHFEWYLEISQILPIISKEATNLDSTKANICIPGNGDSLLASTLALQGYSRVDALDFDPGVVKRMGEINKQENLRYLEKDITSLGYTDPQYDLVIDKGSLDALYSDDTPENRVKALNYLGGVVKGIKHRGKFIIVSLLQDHIIDLVLEFFYSEAPSCCFIPRLYQVIETPQSEEESKETPSDLSKFIKFAFVFEVYSEPDFAKVRALFGNKTTFQTVLPNSDFSKPTIYQSKESVKFTVIKRQKLGLALSGIKQFRLKQRFSIQLSSLSQSQGQLPLYKLRIMDTCDATVLKKKTVLVVVVPLGIEKDSSFSTEEGRVSFMNQCGFTRVILVLRNIGMPQGDTKEVQEDLKDMIGDLIPSDCVNSADIPFTTVPAKEGKRVILGQFGNYRIFEYMSEDQQVLREWVNREGQILGETRVLRKGKAKSKRQKELMERSKHLSVQSPFLEKDKNHHVYLSATHLLGSYHKAALLGLLQFSEQILAPQSPNLNILLIGGTSVLLANFLLVNLPNLKIWFLQENESKIELAKQYFKLTPNDHLQLITNLAQLQDKFDFVVFEGGIGTLPKSNEIIDKLSEKGIVLASGLDQFEKILKKTRKVKLDEGDAFLGSNVQIEIKDPTLLKSMLGEAVFNELKFYQAVE